jgi:predicted DNA-binding transcriptional regulator AlpA
MDSPSIVDEETTTAVFLQPGGEAHRPSTRAGGRSGLWNPTDVARFLQVSRSWVYQKVEAGLLPVIRLPGSSLLRFEPEAIRAFARGEWLPARVPAVHAVKRRK